MSDTPQRTAANCAESYPIIYQNERRDDFEWIGLGSDAGIGVPRVYDPKNDSVFMADFDENEASVHVDESEERELGDETIGEYVADVGAAVGWTWLSEFAHDNLQTTGHDAHMDVIDATFDRRSVAEDAGCSVGFSGSFTYRDDDGRIYALERQFDVYTDEAYRTETDRPTAVVEERYFSAAEFDAHSRVGDAKIEERTRREIPVDVDPETGVELATIDEYCREWHETHPEPLESSR